MVSSVCPSWGGGRNHMIFIDARVKISGAISWGASYSELLYAMREICAISFIFQQCNASAAARRACETINLLEWQTAAFISSHLWPPNSTDLNQLDYKIWKETKQRVYQFHDVDELKQRLIDVWHRFLVKCLQRRRW